jgi:RimJ/RimL family protein N-acetyltransferase
MTAPERIETPRLLLRRPAAADAAAIFSRYAADPEVTRFLAWPMHRSLDDTRAFLSFSDSEWLRGPAGAYLIESRDTGELLGSTGLSFKTDVHAVTGYVLASDAWGCGYATEALTAMVMLAQQLGARQLDAWCHPANLASVRVLEKCGFAREPAREGPHEFPNLAAGAMQACLCYSWRLR